MKTQKLEIEKGERQKGAKPSSGAVSRLKERYNKEIAKTLREEFKIKNPMATPRLTKVVLNMGVGEISRSKELKESLIRDLSVITGQLPTIKKAKVSIATFNLRAGMPVGLTVTLRGDRMYSFFDKLVSLVLPRLRDFKGVKTTSFDKGGSYTIGIAEHTLFPEIEIAKTPNPRSLEVTMVIKSSDKEKSKRLLELLGMPFEKIE